MSCISRFYVLLLNKHIYYKICKYYFLIFLYFIEVKKFNSNILFEL